MATSPSTQKEKMVKIKLFRDDERYKAPVFVGVNGRTWLIPRGVEVEVPECVDEVLRNSANAEAEAEAARTGSGLRI